MPIFFEIKKSCRYGLLALFLLSQSALPLAASPAEKLDQNALAAVQSEAKAQAQIDQWNSQRDELLEEARSLSYELQWLNLQEQRLARYVATNADKINALEDAQARYAIIALALENILLDKLEQMEKSIEQSPPFLAEERARRVNFLQQSLNDPDLNIGEKYRRFMEGLNAESTYAQSLELATGQGILDGEVLDLILIRAGRLAYYCLNLDRSRGGIWNQSTGQFQSLPKEGLAQLQNLENMIQSNQLYNFAILPLQPEAQP